MGIFIKLKTQQSKNKLNYYYFTFIFTLIILLFNIYSLTLKFYFQKQHFKIILKTFILKDYRD